MSDIHFNNCTDFFIDPIVHLEVHDGFTSGGQLPKAWDIKHAILYKGEQSLGDTYCVYSEVICSDLAGLLGIPHVSYWLEEHSYTTGSSSSSKLYKAPLAVCKSFVDAEHIAISLYDIMLKNDCSQNQAVKFICDRNVEFHCKMLLFDFIIANPDRHLRNLGFMKYQNALSVLPLYDHDKALYSMRVNHTGQPFSSIDIYERERLYNTYILNLITIAKRLLPANALKTLCPWEKLLTCESYITRYDGIPAERQQSIISMIKMRTQFMLEELQHD